MSERIIELKALLEETPNDSFLIHALALEYRKINNFEKSSFYFNQNLELHPDYLGTYYAYGKLLEMNHYFHKAKEIYEKGMQVAKAQNDMKTHNELQAAIDWMDEE